MSESEGGKNKIRILNDFFLPLIFLRRLTITLSWSTNSVDPHTDKEVHFVFPEGEKTPHVSPFNRPGAVSR